jgi:hypothetical protein
MAVNMRGCTLHPTRIATSRLSDAMVVPNTDAGGAARLWPSGCEQPSNGAPTRKPSHREPRGHHVFSGVQHRGLADWRGRFERSMRLSGGRNRLTHVHVMAVFIGGGTELPPDVVHSPTLPLYEHF